MTDHQNKVVGIQSSE